MNNQNKLRAARRKIVKLRARVEELEQLGSVVIETWGREEENLTMWGAKRLLRRMADAIRPLRENLDATPKHTLDTKKCNCNPEQFLGEHHKFCPVYGPTDEV